MKKIKTVISIVIVVLLLFGMSAMQSKALTNRPYNYRTAGMYKLTAPALLKIISLGNEQALADYLWIKLILKIGETSRFQEHQEAVAAEKAGAADHQDPHGHEHHHHGPERKFTARDSLEGSYLTQVLPEIFYNYVYTITELDPKFAYTYNTAVLFSMFYFQNYQQTEYWLDRAIKANPEYWEFYFYKAFYLFRIKPSPDSVIVKYLQKSVNAPKSLRIFHKNMSLHLLMAFNQKLNSLQKQIVFLQGLLETLNDDNLRKEIESRIVQLQDSLQKVNYPNEIP